MPALNRSTTNARQRILSAFAECLLEQPYEHMSISGLLRRARVGRTTFYAQFRDKEELFEVSVDGLGQGIARAALTEPEPWGFLRPFLLHVDSHRSIYSGFVGRESSHVLERQMHRLFARLIKDDMTRRTIAKPSAVREVAMVGALWALMVVWIERRLALDPEAFVLEATKTLDALTAT